MLRDRHGRCGSFPIVAAVMSAQLISITNPVLAPGVGFAVLNADGNVLFHSDERRALFENLYEEMSEGQRLRAILDAGIASPLDSNYRARPHLLYARPMESLPWSVVTFMDNEILRTSFLESLMHSVMLMFGHVMLYFLVTLVYLFQKGRSSPDWLWPYFSIRASDYWWMAWMLLVLFPGAALIINNLEGIRLLVLSLVLPLLLILTFMFGSKITHMDNGEDKVRISTVVLTSLFVLIFLRYRQDLLETGTMGYGSFSLVLFMVVSCISGLFVAFYYGRHRTKGSGAVRGPNSSLIAYMTVAVFMWAYLALLPAYGYAKLAVTDQLTVLVKHENQSILRQLLNRKAAVSDSILDIETPPDFTERRLGYGQPDIYWSSMFWKTVDGDEGSAQSHKRERATNSPSKGNDEKLMVSVFPWNRVADKIPIYNETSREMRYFQQTDEDGKEDRRWTISDGGRITFRVLNPDEGSHLELHSSLAIGFPMLGALTLFASVFGLFLTVFWVRYGTRKVYFGDIPPDPHSSKTAGAKKGCPTPKRGLNKKVTNQWLEHELDAFDGLRETIVLDEDQIKRRYGTRREALVFINKQAEDLYRSELIACDEDEKLVLVQLSQESVANPKQPEAVRKLLQRGILRKNPALCIMNQSFAFFVSSVYQPREIAKLERSAPGLNWVTAKGVLLTAFVLLFIFLFTTQPAAVETLTKYLSGVAASVIAIITLVNRFSGKRLGGDGD
jgi:hypothetical protein